jgi:hypothetical protein
MIDNKEERKIKRLDKRRERELSDIRRVIQTPEGRRFYWRMMEKGGVFRDAFCGEDIYTTNYNLGRQSLSRDFLNDLLEADPNALKQMQDERASEIKSEEVIERIEKDNNTGDLV